MCSESEHEKSKLFIGGLSWEATPEAVKDYFGTFGDVEEVKINKDPISGKPRGFGFVTFRNSDSVKSVLGSTCGHTVCGKAVDPKLATAKNTSGTDRKVFIGGIPPIEGDVGDDSPPYLALKQALKDVLEENGARVVANLDIKRDDAKTKHKGFAFATFQTAEQADSACRQHHFLVLSKQVEVKKAEPRPSKHPGAFKNQPMSPYYQSWGGQQQQQQQQQQQYASRGDYYHGNNEYPASGYSYGQTSGYEQQGVYQAPTQTQGTASGTQMATGYDYPSYPPTSHSDSTGYAQSSYQHYPQHHQQHYSYPQQQTAAPQGAHAGYGSGQQQQAAAANYYGHHVHQHPHHSS